MIVHDSLILREARDSDLPDLLKIRNNTELQAQLLSRVRGSRESDVKAWMEGFSAHSDRLLFVIETAAGELAGYIQFTGIDYIDQRAELGICVSGPYQGQGLGGRAISSAVRYLYRTFRVSKIWLRVRADNEAAIRCYGKSGFERCGVLRRHSWIDGSWHDVVVMELMLESSVHLDGQRG